MRDSARVRGRREAGLSLVELMIALVVIAIAILALFSLIVSSSQVQQETREKTLAYNAARQKIEAMRGETFTEIYARYNANTGDNPTTGTSPGNTFTIDGLNTPSGMTAPGLILFPEVTNALAENYTGDGATTMGMPKDLNRDGDATDTTITTTYKILPVLIRVKWRGVGDKTTTIEVSSLITDK
jgi:type II secretory pathway pseudopilin PulG